MTWLLKLYPPRWRRRYGKEFVALIASQRFSFVTVLDIIGGAIDAWTQPQSHLAARAAAQSEGDTIMLAKLMRLRCAGHGAKPTTADAVKGAGVILAGTALSVLVATWMQRQSADPVYTQTLMSSGWLIAFVVSMPYTAAEGMARTDAGHFRWRLVDGGCVAGVRWRVDQQPVRTTVVDWSRFSAFLLQRVGGKGRGRRVLSERRITLRKSASVFLSGESGSKASAAFMRT